MNRKQRRAALKQRQPSAPGMRRAPTDPAKQLFAEAALCQQQNELDKAARLYKRLLLRKPDHAQANNNLAIILQTQGKLGEASTRFAQALTLMPQLFEQAQRVYATLVAVLPPLGEAIRRTVAAWPRRLPADELFGGAGLVAIAGDPLLLCLLQAGPVRDVALERTMTALRAALLMAAGGKAADDLLVLACALAKQCFINEYVFATTAEEEAQAERLKAIAKSDLSPMQLAAFAMYQPLHALPGADALLARKWPPAVDDLLTQQLREPAEERALAAAIPRLTSIEDPVSLRVQQQYEENPYPRWVHVPGMIEPISVEQYLQRAFPGVPFTTPPGSDGTFDMLIAGCGTGRQSILLAHNMKDVRVLAIDLSLASLAFAKRRTPSELATRLEYAQADILKLASLDRRFDVIDTAGVLHHLADPLQGWRMLLGLLRPGGLMHLGFYSELGRRDVVAARQWIVERGYNPTPADIRRCRQDIIGTPLGSVARFHDFFSASECRDLLFHVQEARVSIPAIKSFLTENGLDLLGFEFEAGLLQRYRTLFADAGWLLTDLDRWHDLETRHPDTFSGMYQLWVQRS